MFGVGFKLSRPPANYQCSRSKMQSRPCFALGSAYTYVRKWHEFFSSERCIGAVVCSLSRVYLSIMQLPEASFVLFLRLALGADPLLVKGRFLRHVKTRHFHAKSDFSMQENMFGVGFKLRRPQANHQCSRRKEAAPTLLCTLFSIVLSKKRANVSFLSKDALGLSFVP